MAYPPRFAGASSTYWKRKIGEIESLANELYRWGHAHEGELACEFASVAADILNAISDARPRIENAAASIKKKTKCAACGHENDADGVCTRGGCCNSH